MSQILLIEKEPHPVRDITKYYLSNEHTALLCQKAFLSTVTKTIRTGELYAKGCVVYLSIPSRPDTEIIIQQLNAQLKTFIEKTL